MASMDESIAWAIENKEWVLGASTASFGGVFALVKFCKKPSSASPANARDDSIHIGAINTSDKSQTIVGQNVTVNERDPTTGKAIDRLVKQLETKDLQLQERDEQIKQLTAAVEAFAQVRADSAGNSQSRIDEARKQLALGESEQAEAIFQSVADQKASDIQQAAEAHRHIGALAFLHDTDKALNAYRRATELDPENSGGWNQYGRLLVRVGEPLAAESAYNEVLRLGKLRGDEELLAMDYGNLGIVYETCGDLDQAEVMYKNALGINEALGNQKGMASDYASLGIIYKRRADQTQGETAVRHYLKEAKKKYWKARKIFKELRGEGGIASTYTNLGNVYRKYAALDQVEAKICRYLNLAEAVYRRSLGINKALGRQVDMATDYGNLSTVYFARRDFDQEEEMWMEAMAIFEKLGYKEGMARECANRAVSYLYRGHIDQAKAKYGKSVSLYRAIGAVAMAENRFKDGWIRWTKEGRRRIRN